MDVEPETTVWDRGARACLADMPWEVTVAIAGWTDGDTVCALARCCRALEPLARDSGLWRSLCLRAFPQVLIDRLCADAGCDSGTRWRWEYAIRAFPARTSRACVDGHVVDVEVGQRIEYLTERRVCVRRGRFLSRSPHRALTAGGIRVVIGTERSASSDTRCHVTRTSEYVYSLSLSVRIADRINKAVYANGNVWAYRQTTRRVGDGESAPKGQKTVWFRFSQDCPDRRFAGMLLFRCKWTDLSIVVQNGDGFLGRENIFRPYAGTREAAAFDMAVLADIVGWDDVRRRAYIREFGVGICAHPPLISSFFLSTPPCIDDALMVTSESTPLDAESPWRVATHPDDVDAPFDVQPASWRRIVCPLTGELCAAGRDRCVLSSGRVYDAAAASAWFDLLENNDAALCDPVTEEPVAPDIFHARWWMQGLDKERVAASVWRAYRRLWTLIADGADLLATPYFSRTVACLAALDAFANRSHVALRPHVSNDMWLARNADCVQRMRKGNLSETDDEWRRTAVVWNFQLVTAVDVHVPPHPSNEKGAREAVSFLGARLVRVTFRDREFIRGAFGGAVFVGCRFVRCRFIDCSFVDACFDGCRFEDCAFMALSRNESAPAVPIASSGVHDVLARLGCHRVHDTS